MNGEIIAYRVDTLCGEMTSLLTRNLLDALWVQDNTIVTENGKACVLMEYPGVDLNALVEYSHLKRITGEGCKEVQLSNMSDYMSRLINHLYVEGVVESHCNVDSTTTPSDDETASSYCHNMDSIILPSDVEEDNIMEWLESIGKTETPKLLYRASRDGWDSSDFHRMCDGKGATVTVVESSDGYIFGGYTDVAWGTNGEWKSSTESFLFSLEDYEGIGPVKMPIKSDMTDFAVLHDIDNGPLFGGSTRGDLRIASENSETSSCDIGETYELPSDTDDPKFFTGTEYFTVSDYEVFLV